MFRSTKNYIARLFRPNYRFEDDEPEQKDLEMQVVDNAPRDDNSVSAWKIVTSLSTIILSKENRPQIIAASVLTAINSALNFVAPYILGETIDSFVNNREPEFAGMEVNTVTILLMLFAAGTLNQLVPNFRDQVLAPVAACNTRKILNSITEHQLHKSLDYHSKTPFGDQVYLLQKGFATASVGTNLLTHIAPSLFEITMAVAVLSARYDAGLGLGVVGTAAMFTLYSAKTTKPVIESRELSLRKTNIAWEKITNAMKQYKNIHDFGKYEYEMSKVREAVIEAMDSEIKAMTSPLKVGVGQIIIPRLGMLAACLYVGVGVTKSQFSVDDFVLLINYLEKLSSLLPSVGAQVNGLFASYPDLRFVFGELNKPDEMIDSFPSRELKLDESAPHIRFENVTFGYKDKPPLFENISFEIKAGQTVAFVSKSGGGKSSLFKLLYRYNDPSAGTIYINDQDISEVSLTSLRSSIGLIAQTPNLFNGTIRENIQYGARDPESVADAQIWAMARRINLSEFLDNFEKKLDTPVGEDGKGLSGGEQQRVAILRSLFKPASIRLFDEITSGLDSVTADDILAGIENVTRGQTKLFITHKLMEAQGADKIIVLHEGKIIAQGTHQQLLGACDLYQELWVTQNQAEQASKMSRRKSL